MTWKHLPTDGSIYKVRKNTINGRCATRIVLFVAMIILSWGLILVCQFLLSAGEVVQKMSGRVSGYLQLMPGIFGLHQISLHHVKFILSENHAPCVRAVDMQTCTFRVLYSKS